jgi:hypothetical protein
VGVGDGVIGGSEGVGEGVGGGVTVGVTVAVAVGLGGGAVELAVAVGVGVGVGAPDCAQYFPPFLRGWPESSLPPQTIISLPLQIAVCSRRALGALVVLVPVQLSVLGLYRPPVFTSPPVYPPQTIISTSLQIAV